MAPEPMTELRNHLRIGLRSVALLGASVAIACSTSGPVDTVTDVRDRSARVDRPLVPPPITLEGSAFDAAGEVKLPDVRPGNYPGFVNVYRFSDRIITGSEPTDEEAFAQLSAWGVKTVLSVDGKTPDVEGALRHGLRYVHIPIQYKGLTEDQIARIAKTFRELEAPFYVHCYHGKHRGPAAGAIGAVVLDGMDREQAIAEMRYWCSTASKYEGLYAAVATADLPTAETTAGFAFDFTSAQRFDGIRDAMIVLTRSWDEVKVIRRNGWALSADHPDIDPLRSAMTVRDHLDACAAMDEVAIYADDFREWLDVSRAGTSQLVELLGEDPSAAEGTPEALEAAYDVVSESCLDCHSVYRNR